MKVPVYVCLNCEDHGEPTTVQGVFFEKGLCENKVKAMNDREFDGFGWKRSPGCISAWLEEHELEVSCEMVTNLYLDMMEEL